MKHIRTPMSKETSNDSNITLTKHNAKKFASRLKKTLKTENVDFNTSKCYDILAQTFGSSNWHELSQHLDKPFISIIDDWGFYDSQPQSSSTIFSINWHEFNFLVTQMCKTLNINDITTELICAFLEIFKDKQYNEHHSFLNYQSIHTLLDEQNLIINWLVHESLGKDINVVLNSLFVENVSIQSLNINLDRKNINTFEKILNSEQRSKESFDPDAVFSFFKLLLFLNDNNPVIKKAFHTFVPNDIILYPEKLSFLSFDCPFTSDHPFISHLLQLAFPLPVSKDISFHEIFIYLFSRTNYLLENHKKFGSQFMDLKNYQAQILKPMYTHSTFCQYLLNNLHLAIVNTLTQHSFNESNTDFHTISIDLHFIPNSRELKHMLLRLNDMIQLIPNNNNHTSLAIFKKNVRKTAKNPHHGNCKKTVLLQFNIHSDSNIPNQYTHEEYFFQSLLNHLNDSAHRYDYHNELKELVEFFSSFHVK